MGELAIVCPLTASRPAEEVDMKRPTTGQTVLILDGDEQAPAFVPEPLPPWPPIELSELQPALDTANLALGRLDGITPFLPDPDLFIYAYVRREALMSSQIEGTQSSLSDLLLFELEEAPGAPVDDVSEVLNYVKALQHGLEHIRSGEPIDNRLMRALHGILLRSGRGSDKDPGRFREAQNWIGGRRPSTALYVPPPPSEVENCMRRLEQFITDDDDLPPLIRAGAAHVQFETIHPFLDGNGRVGRLLVALMLQRDRVLREPVLYLSLYLKERRSTYYHLLDVVRRDGDWETWLAYFLEGIAMTAEDAYDTTIRLRDLFEQDRASLRTLGRRSSSALRAHEALMKRPILSINAIQRQSGLSRSAAASAVADLMQLNMAREITGRRRDRVFAYGQYLDILSEGAEPL